MAFGWSFPKIMVLITLAVLLFGVPLLTWLVILKERGKRRSRQGDWR
jgi:hypothetical protein